MAAFLTPEQVRTELRRACGKNQRRWATQNLVSPSYLSEVLNGRKPPGRVVLEALGLEEVTVYRKKEA